MINQPRAPRSSASGANGAAGGGANGAGARQLFPERRPNRPHEFEKLVLAPKRSLASVIILQKSFLETRVFISFYTPLLITTLGYLRAWDRALGF